MRSPEPFSSWNLASSSAEYTACDRNPFASWRHVRHCCSDDRRQKTKTRQEMRSHLADFAHARGNELVDLGPPAYVVRAVAVSTLCLTCGNGRFGKARVPIARTSSHKSAPLLVLSSCSGQAKTAPAKLAPTTRSVKSRQLLLAEMQPPQSSPALVRLLRIYLCDRFHHP